jgi:cysteine-rich repeat protein
MIGDDDNGKKGAVMRFTCLSPQLFSFALAITFVQVGCKPEDAPSDTGTESETGDGDGDGETGDGDGDGEPGDGDGDGDTGDGDGDTGECTTAGCACDPDAPDACDMGLYCSDVDMTCTAPLCGNAEIEPSEQCEDGNDVEGDGCDNDCSFTEILQVEAAYLNTCVLIEGGRVRCWGYNGSGELGYGHTDNIGDDETPADAGDVMLPVAGTALTLGDQHACILMANSNIRCWGTGYTGALGYASTENVGDDEFPLAIADVMVGGAVLEVDAGGSQTCARLDNGKLRCWGQGGGGQLGYGNLTTIGDDEFPSAAGDVLIGGAVIAQSTGIGHTCAITANGNVRCWGNNFSGQLGYGNTTPIGSMNTPQQAGDASVVPLGLDGSAATALALGLSNSCALFETGDVLCWGSGNAGTLGQGSNVNIGDDELPSTLPPIELPGTVVAISTGDTHVCALFDDQRALCWGANFYGQLGAATSEDIGDDEMPSSLDPLLLPPIRQIDAGGNHTCAIIEESNELYCWGTNSNGELGYGHMDTIGDDESLVSAGPVQLF